MKKLAIIAFALAILSAGIVHALIGITSVVTDAASYSPGDTVTATSTVTNNDGTVKKDIVVEFEYNDPDGLMLNTETKNIKRINAGSSKTISSTYTLSSSASGSYTVVASVIWNGSTNDTTQTTFVVGGSLPPTSSVGEALFDNKCIMCHGEFGAGGYAHRSIKGAQASRIRNAMNKWPEMDFLSDLTDAELADIETYLGNVPRGDKLPRHGDFANGELQFRQSCTYCHSFDGTIDHQPGPDLMGISTAFSDTWLGAWTDFPKEMVAAHAIGPESLADYPYVMPDLGHQPVDVWDIVDFLVEQENIGPVVDSSPVFDTETDPRFEASKQVYFNHCAGCHGINRGKDAPPGTATGPTIDDARSQAIGTDGLIAILRYGTPKGMGNFGQADILSDEEISNLAAYLQLPPPDAPELPFDDIMASWDLVVPVANRPTAPEHLRNWENYTGVILRDAGQVAIFDGDSHEEVVRLSTGFAVHILRSSSSGRYFYAIGRDGLVTMIDLWTTVPTIVANVKGCHDARSVEASKLGGYEDTYLIEGCYWPPQYVVYDGLTLEPQNLVDLRTPPGPTGILTDIDGAEIPENRVASIVASHNDPVWVVSLKESGFVGIVDYSLTGHPMTSKIPAAKALHDGGFDSTGNYFLVAANASNKMVVIDLVNQSLAATIDTGTLPHPGRGVNWQDPVYGWVNATSHIGEGKVLVYGADPVGRSDVAWQIVREITLPDAGSLFIKSHPTSPWVLVDMTKSNDGREKDICAIEKMTGTLATGTIFDEDGCITVAANGSAVHMEFNMDGSEVWVSDWSPNGAVIVLDSTTLTEIRRFTGLPTPTGKFNVFNTAHDIY